MGFSFKVKKDQLPQNSVTKEMDIRTLDDEPADAPSIAEQSDGFSLESRPNVEVPPETEQGAQPDEGTDPVHPREEEVRPVEENTVRMTNSHASFLERSKLTGIAPPLRSGTVTGLIVAEKLRSQRLAMAAKALGILAVPAIAGAVFYFLGASSQETNLASTDTPANAVPKNPNKAKKPVLSDAQPPAAPGAAPEPGAKAAVDPLKSVIVLSAPGPADGDVINQSIAAMTIGLTPEHKPRSLIKLSIQPITDMQGAIGRGSPAMILTRQEYALLSKWVEQDPSAKFYFDEWVRSAREALATPPAPVAQFKVATPADRGRTAEALNELEHIRSLHLGLLVTGDQAMLGKLREVLMAWARTYQSTGDALLDSQLEPIFEAYGAYSKSFSENERQFIDDWLLKIADTQATESIGRTAQDDRWYAHHLKTMAYIGFATGNTKIQQYVRPAFAAHLARAIVEEGQTTTYHSTHSIQLHADHLAELLKVSILLDRIGQGQNEVEPVPGSVLARAVNFSLPYIVGKMDHTEFEPVKDPEIKARQERGDPFVSKHQFQPINALPFMEVLLYFRPSLAQEVAHLTARPGTRFSTERGLYFASMTRRIPVFDPPPIAAAPVRAPAAPMVPVNVPGH